MDQKSRKIRAFGLLLATGFASGLFVQFNAPRLYSALGAAEPTRGAPAAPEAQVIPSETETAAAAPPAPVAAIPNARADAQNADRPAAEPRPEDTAPQVLRRYEAVAAVIGNTLEIAGPGGEARHIYFAPRGLVAEFDGRGIEARQWSRDDDHVCRALGAERRECFYLVVTLDASLRGEPAAALDARLHSGATGAVIGTVRGFGEGEVKLLRGDPRGLPGYIPLMDDKPGPDWTRDAGESFVGALLLRRAEDEDRAATFFAPNGQVFEVTRSTRQAVRLWIGAWRRQGDLICRTLNPTTAGSAPDPAQEECAHARAAGDRVEFAEAAPARRAWLRWPWPEAGAHAGAAAQAAEITLAPTARAGKEAFGASFTDLR